MVTGTGTVTMRPRENPGTGPRFYVLDPYGNEIDQSESASQGLQEAINYAFANGYGLDVIGGANSNAGEPDHMVITAQETIEVPPARFWTWRMRGITLNGPMTAADLIHFDSLVNSVIDWPGVQLVYMGEGANAAVHFHPRNPPPTDPTTGMGASLIHIPNTIAVYGDGGACVRFSPSAAAPVFGNRMVFGEINAGAAEGGATGTMGILIVSVPGEALFASNEIGVYAGHASDFQLFRIGSTLDQRCIMANNWRLKATSTQFGTILNTFASGDTYEVDFINSGVPNTVGAREESIAEHNLFRGWNDCAIPYTAVSGAGPTINEMRP